MEGPSNSGSASGAKNIMELRAKYIIDVSSFWAQIGTSEHLVEFNALQRKLSSWCESHSSTLETTSSLTVDKIVAVRGPEEGVWLRGKVMKVISQTQVELFYIDTGQTDSAEASTIHSKAPPMLCELSQQALDCTLKGVEKLEGAESWSEEAMSRFKEILSFPTKCIIHQIRNGRLVILSIFAPYDGVFTSVGEILKREGLAQYNSSSDPVTLDLHVPAGSSIHSACSDTTNKLPPIPIFSDQDQECRHPERVPEIGEVETRNARGRFGWLDSDEDCSMMKKPPSPLDGLRGPSLEGHTPFSTPPVDSADDKNEDDEAIEKAKGIQQEASPGHFPPPLISGAKVGVEAGGGAAVGPTAAAKTGEEKAEAEKCSRETGEDSSGSSLSDNDWLDEDLLPRRSGNSEVSSVSPQKEEKEAVVESGVGSAGSYTQSVSHSWRGGFNKKLLSDAGHTPIPSSRKLNFMGSSRGRVGSAASSSSMWGDTPRYGAPRGRGQGTKYRGGGGGSVGASFGTGGRNRRDDVEEKERLGGTLRWGRGRGSSPDKVPRFQSPSISQTPSIQPYPAPSKSSPAEPHPSLLPTPPPAALGAGGKSSPLKYSEQLKGMTSQEVQDEVKWQEWKIEKAIGKVLDSLNSENISSFGEEVEKILHGTAAEKLQELPKSHKPLELVVEAVVKRGMEEGCMDSALLAAAVGSMMEACYGDSAAAALKKILTKMSTEITKCEDKAKVCRSFCAFLSSLFTHLSSTSSKCGEIITSCVGVCLQTWSGFVAQDSYSYSSERQGKLRVECFGYLLDTLPLGSSAAQWEGVLMPLLEGPIKDSILCDKFPRYIRGAWYNQSIKILKVLFKVPTSALPMPAVAGQEKVFIDAAAAASVNRPLDEQSPLDVSKSTGSDPGVASRLVVDTSSVFQPNTVSGCQQEQVMATTYPPPLMSSQPAYLVGAGLPPPAPPTTATTPQGLGPLPLQRSLTPPGAPQVSATIQQLPGPQTQGQGPDQEPAESYSKVLGMLKALRMTELFPKFQAAMIKDSVLGYEIVAVKECMREAGIPSGPILEITHYLQHAEKGCVIPDISQPPSPSPTPIPPPQLSYYQQQLTPMAGKRARHYSMYGGVNHDVGGYAPGGMASSIKPTSPLATFQLLPPPPPREAKQLETQPTVFHQQPSMPVAPQIQHQPTTTSHVMMCQPSLPSTPELQPAATYYQGLAEPVYHQHHQQQQQVTTTTYQPAVQGPSLQLSTTSYQPAAQGLPLQPSATSYQPAAQGPPPMQPSTSYQPAPAQAGPSLQLQSPPPLQPQPQGQGSQPTTTFQPQPPPPPHCIQQPQLQGSLQPLSPQAQQPAATTAYGGQAILPPATQQLPFLPHQVTEGREGLETQTPMVATVGSPATGQRGIKLPSSASTPATPTLPTAPRGGNQDKHSPQLVVEVPSSSAQPSPQQQQQQRFARVTCVSCGASDHPTPQCPDRHNFFTHM